MPAAPTRFLPAERLSVDEIQAQADRIAASPGLVAMLDTTPGMIAIVNRQRQIVFCNNACIRARGLSRREQAVGMRPGELLNCVHRCDEPGGCGTGEACRFCGLTLALVSGQQGQARQSECLVESDGANGTGSAEYAVDITPLPDLGQGWQCYALTDISPVKRRQALEHTFFHDIMNRASAVQGVSDALAIGGMSPAEVDEFLDMLAISASALVDEIRSQRTLLAAENGELAVTRTACDSLRALSNAVAACQSLGLPDHKQILIAPGARSASLNTDVTLLGRVLINLIKNALEASGSGGTITTTCEVLQPGRVRFTVHNDAVMPESVRAHVFQRAFSTKGIGRGLGTYSVRLITERYLGGIAWFDSAPDSGTTFGVEFHA